MAGKHTKSSPKPAARAAPAAAAVTPPPAEASAWEDVQRQLDAQAPMPGPHDVGYAEFELDFEQALARQLGPFFEKLTAAPLTSENVIRLVKPEARGAYYLLLDGVVVYIGKSDAKDGLRVRLLRHCKTLKRRRNINWPEMRFKAVKVSSLAALDTESLLLDLYRRKARFLGAPSKPAWNFSGFGSNDTGVERDTQKVSIFDQRHPLDLDADIEFEEPLSDDPRMSLDAYLKWLARQLRFTFRRQSEPIPARSSLASVFVKPGSMTSDRSLRGLLLAVHATLPDGWVLTVLRGKVVLYLNDHRSYKSPLWRLEAGKEAQPPDDSLGEVGGGADDGFGDS